MIHLLTSLRYVRIYWLGRGFVLYGCCGTTTKPHQPCTVIASFPGLPIALQFALVVIHRSRKTVKTWKAWENSPCEQHRVDIVRVVPKFIHCWVELSTGSQGSPHLASRAMNWLKTSRINYGARPPTSTLHPPDVTHMINAPKLPCSLPLFNNIMVNTNWRAKNRVGPGIEACNVTYSYLILSSWHFTKSTDPWGIWCVNRNIMVQEVFHSLQVTLHCCFA